MSRDERAAPYRADELEGVKNFAGRYHVGEKLGQGSYGCVYRAIDTRFGERGITRSVALKVLKPMAGRGARDRYSDGRRERFLRESRMVASLKDARIVDIYDKGEKDGLVFAAYEFVEGETLADYLNRGKVFSPLEWVKLLEQILDALDEAHTRQIVHRDIKPDNLMITSHARRGFEIKVLDFGIGKYVGDDEHVRQDFSTMTKLGEAVGTARYMSPEVFTGGKPTPAADIWALGLVSVGALTGELALPGDVHTLMGQIMSAEPLEVAPDLSHVPAHLRQVLDRMIAKDLSVRYPDARAVLRDLEGLKGASSGWEFSVLASAEPRAAAPVTAEVAAGAAGEAAGREVTKAPGRRWPPAWIAGGAALAALALGAGAWFSSLVGVAPSARSPEEAAGAAAVEVPEAVDQPTLAASERIVDPRPPEVVGARDISALRVLLALERAQQAALDAPRRRPDAPRPTKTKARRPRPKKKEVREAAPSVVAEEAQPAPARQPVAEKVQPAAPAAPVKEATEDEPADPPVGIFYGVD